MSDQNRSSQTRMEQSRAFLRWLLNRAPDESWFELTAIAPPHLDLSPRVMTQSFRVVGGELDGVRWDKVAEANQRGYGIYYALTLKRAPVQNLHTRSKEADTDWIIALWADFDGQDFVGGKDGTRDASGNLQDDGALDGLLSVWPVAHAIIDSGGGYHGIWRTEPLRATEKNMRRVKAALRGIAKEHGADTHAVDMARVFRLPGTVNTKEGRGGVCKLLSTHNNPQLYTLDDFTEYVAAGTEQPVQRVKHAPLPENISRAAQRYIERWNTTPHTRGTRNEALFNAAYFLYSERLPEGEIYAALLPRALADGLSEREARTTIASALRYEPGTPTWA